MKCVVVGTILTQIYIFTNRTKFVFTFKQANSPAFTFCAGTKLLIKTVLLPLTTVVGDVRLVTALEDGAGNQRESSYWRLSLELGDVDVVLDRHL